MSGRSLLTGAAVFATAFLVAGCGETTTPTSTKNADTRTNSAPRSPDRDPVQDTSRTTTSDTGTRAASQDRAAADNADKQAAGMKQDYNGVAKPIGDSKITADSKTMIDSRNMGETRTNNSVNSIEGIHSTDTRTSNSVTTPAVVATDTNTTATDKPRAVDNSGQNETDKQGTSMTPMDQGTSEADINVTRTIRKALTGDSTLSTNAQNLKVITSNGVVVLRGPVASQAEADAVMGHARTAAGASRIENQIAVPAP